MRLIKDNIGNLLQILLLIFLATGFFFVAASVQGKLTSYANNISSQYINQLTESYNINITYSGLSSQFIHRLIVDDIKISLNDTNSIEIEKLVISYDFISLIRYFIRHEGTPVIKKCFVNDYNIIFYISESGNSTKFSHSDAAVLLDLLPDIRFSDGNARIITPDFSVNAGFGKISFDQSSKNIYLDSRGSVSLRLGELKTRSEITYSLSTKARVNDLWNGLKGSLQITEAKSRLNLSKKLDLLFILENKTLSFAKKKDKQKIDLQGEIDLDSLSGGLTVSCSRFSINDIIFFNEKDVLPDFILDSSVSGDFSLNWNQDFIPEYSGNIRLYVPERALLPEKISLNLNFKGNREMIDVLYGKVYWKTNKSALRGRYNFNTGQYYFDINDFAYSLSNDYQIGASGTVRGNGKTGTIKTRNLSVNESDIGNLNLSASFSDNAVYSDFIFSQKRTEDKFLSGNFVFNTITKELTSGIKIENYRINQLIDLINPEMLPDNLNQVRNYSISALTKIQMKTDNFDSLYIESGNVFINDSDFYLPEIGFELKYSDRNIEFLDVLVEKEDQRISGELEITFLDLKHLNFNAGILYNNNNYIFQGLVHEDLLLLKENSYLSCLINRKEDSFEFNIDLKDFPVPEYLKTSEYYPELVSVKTSGRYMKNQFPEFNTTDLVFSNQYPYAGQTEVRTKIEINEENILLNYFHADSESLGVYQGQGAVSLDYKSDMKLWAEITGEGNQNYRIAYDKTTDVSDLYLFAQNIPLGLLKKNFLGGSVDADIKGLYKNQEWKFTGLLSSESFQFRGKEYVVTGNLTADKNRVDLNGLNFDGEKVGISDVNLQYSVENKKLTGKTDKIDLKNFKITTGAEWDVLIDGNYVFGNVMVDPVFMRDQLFIGKKVFSLEKKDELFRGAINKGKDLLVNFNQKNKKLDLSLSGDMPVHMDISGSIKDKYINYSVKDIEIDANIASYFIPLEIENQGKIFVVDEGLLTGKCTIQGQSSDPEIYGTINISDLKASSPLILEDLHIDNTKVILQGRRITFLPSTWLTGEKDNGLIEGYMDLENGSPVFYNFRLSITGKKGLSVKVPFSGIVMEGYIQSDVSVSGSKESAVLTGDIEILDSEIYLGEGFVLEKGNKDQGFELQTELSLFVNKRVFAYIPNKTIPVIKASLKNGNSLQIKQNTLTGIFNLEGEISLDKGDINYFGRIFSIEEGYIQFNEDQINFNPRIYVRAVIDEEDDMGDVEISLIYNDRLMNDFSPVFTSNPARTNEQIMAIMGETFNSPLNSEAGTLTSLIGTGSSYATQLVLATPIEEGLRKWLNMDYVSLRTSLIENIVVLSQSDTETTLSQYLDNTSLSLGKSLNDDIQFSSELAISYNDISYTENNFNGFEFNTEFSLEFTTPLFDLIWSIAPDSPEDLFVSDNTITIIKKFTY